MHFSIGVVSFPTNHYAFKNPLDNKHEISFYFRKKRGCPRYYSTCSAALESKVYSGLNPYFVTGFCDGESSFVVTFMKSSNHRTGWRLKLVFSISLHNKDRAILERIQNYFGVGKIYKGTSP